jgi:hypothetical protein
MTANRNSNHSVYSEFSLLNQIPTVLRARGFRLYTNSGRLIDLWQNGGAVVLGHTPPNILHEMKNTASRGLYAPFPHFTEDRFVKALSKLLPGYNFRLYAAPPPELASLFNCGAASLWRPFIKAEAAFAAEDTLLVPVLPCIHTWRNNLPIGLCVAAAKTENSKAENPLEQLPESDILSPVLFAMATRGIYDLLASPQRGKPVLPRTAKALKNSKNWQRRGIYLSLNKEPSPEIWSGLFRQFLNAGFLLPPIPSHPLILPGELSPGEDAKLAGVLSANIVFSALPQK